MLSRYWFEVTDCLISVCELDQTKEKWKWRWLSNCDGEVLQPPIWAIDSCSVKTPHLWQEPHDVSMTGIQRGKEVSKGSVRKVYLQKLITSSLPEEKACALLWNVINNESLHQAQSLLIRDFSFSADLQQHFKQGNSWNHLFHD